MKRFLPSSFLLAPLFLAGQATPKALLWDIGGNGLERPSHLYGTVHSKDERAYAFSRAVEGTMDQVVTVAGELDLDAVRKSAVAMMAAMTIPDGGKLEDLYSKKEWKLVDAAMREHLGPMAGMFMRLKPFFVMATLTEASMGQDRPKMLDEHLLAEAKGKGRRVIGLETMDEQLKAIDALPLKEQAAMLLEHLKRGGDAADLEAMMEAYAAQDLDKMMAVTQRTGGLPKALEKSLFTDRNLRMAHRMDSVMRADGNALFLVGAAHLPGKGGVIELLREKGYTVTDRTWLPRNPWTRNDTLGYAVEFPGPIVRIEPKQAAPNGGRMVNWSTELPNGSSYMVFTCYLAPEQATASSDSLLARIAKGDDRTPGTLLRIGEVDTAQGKVWEVLAHYPRKNRYSLMRMYRPASDRAYILMVSPPQGEEKEDGAERFFASFEILEP